jgi:hypothetical protein
MIPFGVLIASYGVRALLESRSRLIVFTTYVLLAAVPIHFAIFAADYFGTHNAMAFSRRDPYDFRELSQRLAALDANEPAPAVLLAFYPARFRSTWWFYMNKPIHASLAGRTRFVADEAVPDAAPPRGLVVVADATLTPARLGALERLCERQAVMQMADGQSTLSIWRRQ